MNPETSLSPEFEDMLALGWRILSEGPQLVLVLRTADGSLHQSSLWHVLEGDFTGEDALLREVAGQQVTHIIALWDKERVDLPSIGFRRKLLQLCPHAEDALILLQTGIGTLPLPLSQFPM